MTLTSTTNRSTHTGDNATTVFSYSFKIFDQSEIDVYLDGVLKTITTHYTVSGVGSDSGGNITFGTEPATAVAIVFTRNIANTQTTDYTVTGQINPQTIEDALDKLTMQTQKVQLNSDEGFGFADSVTDAGNVKISSNAATRASKVVAFDASGGLTADQEMGTSKGDWATSTAYVVRDIIKDTSNNNIYIALTAHTSSGSQPISSNADSAKWRLIVDAASATTSAAAAATSATNAATSATAAASSSSSASTSSSSAATSATNSANSATSSASSASSSATSATSSSEYATKVSGAVTGSDYSAKAWSIGGTGVTDTSSRGAAKEWATAAEDDQVDGSEYSAKHYATKASASATAAANSSATIPATATIKDGTYWGYTTAGSANTYTLTTAPTISAYAADMFFYIKLNASNTGASTINVDSVGAKNIKKFAGAGMIDLAANDLEANGIYTIIYDGTQFLLVGGAGSTGTQANINAADIFLLNSRRLSDHSANVLNVVDGFVDNFQDGSTQNNTAIDISGSTGITHDNTSKYWENTRGGSNQNSDVTYDTEGELLWQEWTPSKGTATVNATFTNGSATVTIASSSWPTNAVSCRIKLDSHGTWYDVLTRDSATQLTLGANFGGSTGTGAWTMRAAEINSSVVELNTQSATIADASNYKLLLPLDNTTDYSNVPKTMSLSGATISTEQSVFGGSSLKLDTNNEYISTADHNDFDLPNDSAWQFKWRQYTTQDMPTGQPSNVAGNGNGSGSGYILNWHNNSGQRRFRLTTDAGINFNVTSGQYPVNTWIACCFSYDGSNARFYINGSQIGSAQSLPSPWNASSSAFKVGDANVGGWYSLQGYIDEFIFQRGGTVVTGSSYTVETSAFTLTTSSSVVSEYVSVCDTEAQKVNTASWSNIDSAALTETKNSQTIYYWYIFDPASSFGAGTEVKIFNQTGSVWRRIAYNDSGTWKYNNNASHNATWTEATATVNDMLHCVSQSKSAQAANRMTKADLEAVTDGEFEAANGWSTSTDALVRGLTLYSSSNSQNPSVDLHRIQYDSANAQATFKSRVFGGTNMPPLAGSAPTNIVLEVIDNQITGTPVYKVSRDGGSNYDTVSSFDIEDTMADGTTVRLADVTMAAATGTSPLVSIEQSAVGHDYRLYSLGLKYK